MKTQTAEVYYNAILAGHLARRADGTYTYTYAESYLRSAEPAISLSLPKRPTVFVSPVLFPFFFGLLAEGTAKQAQCRLLRIDERDHFTRLLRTAHHETIGAVTVREVFLSSL